MGQMGGLSEVGIGTRPGSESDTEAEGRIVRRTLASAYVLRHPANWSRIYKSMATGIGVGVGGCRGRIKLEGEAEFLE
jgi:hypothetical protein